MAHGGFHPDVFPLIPEEVAGEARTLAQWRALLRRFDPIQQQNILQDQLDRGTLTLAQISLIGANLNLDVTFPQAQAAQETEARRQEEAPAKLREEAFTRQQALTERATQPIPTGTPASEAYFSFIEGLESPAMQDFFRRNVPPELATEVFGGAQADTGLQSALAQLEARKDVRSRAQRGLREVTPATPALAPFGSGSFLAAQESVKARQEAQERLTRTRGGVRSASERVRAIRKAKTPFQLELEQFPFLERFRSQTPRQRGDFSASKLRPVTRFLGF